MSNKDQTIHSVGIGTSATDRKNAHEITTEGKHYIFGVGGYTGKSITGVKSLQEVLDEKGSGGTSAPSDWNAIEGETGHIENKICRFLRGGQEYKFTNALNRADFTPIPNEYGEVYLYKKPVDFYDLQWVVTNRLSDSMGEYYPSAIHPAEYAHGRYHVPLRWGDLAQIWVEEEEETYQNYIYVETMFDGGFPEDNTVFIVSTEEDAVDIEVLPEAFIPNTIARTSQLPDSVVWKYMQNPFILQTGRLVPYELLVRNGNGWDFKYKIPSMYLSTRGNATSDGKLSLVVTESNDYPFYIVSTLNKELEPEYGDEEALVGFGNEFFDKPGDQYDKESFTSGVWLVDENRKCYIAV